MGALDILARTTAGLSIIGASFIIVSYILFRGLRFRGRTILCLLSLMDLMTAIVLILPSNVSWCCTLQGMVGGSCFSASFIFSCGMSIYVYMCIFRPKKEVRLFCRCLYIFGIAYPMACLIAVVALGLDYIQDGAPWCIVTDEEDHGDMMRFIWIYGPIWTGMVIALSCNVMVYMKLKSTTDPDKTKKPKAYRALRTLLFVPVVFIILRIPGSINRIYEAVEPGTGQQAPTPALLYLQAIVDPAQGLINSIFFVATSKQVRRRWAEALGEIFGLPVYSTFATRPDGYLSPADTANIVSSGEARKQQQQQQQQQQQPAHVQPLPSKLGGPDSPQIQIIRSHFGPDKPGYGAVGDSNPNEDSHHSDSDDSQDSHRSFVKNYSEQPDHLERPRRKSSIEDFRHRLTPIVTDPSLLGKYSTVVREQARPADPAPPPVQQDNKGGGGGGGPSLAGSYVPPPMIYPEKDKDEIKIQISQDWKLGIDKIPKLDPPQKTHKSRTTKTPQDQGVNGSINS